MKEVLILEDKKETRELLAKIVKEIDANVLIYEVEDEKEAADIALKRQIDVFLIDIILHPQKQGDVAGGEFAQNIRSIKKYYFTPIIIITSLYDPKVSMYSSIHCYEFVEKPFDIKKLQDSIQKALCYDAIREEKKVIFRREGMLELLSLHEIIYFESVGHKLYVNALNGKRELPYQTCQELLHKLNDERFVQCRRGTIVNLEYITGIDIVNRYIYLNADTNIIEMGPIHKKKFLQSVREWGITII